MTVTPNPHREAGAALPIVRELREAANGFFPTHPLGDYGVCDEAADRITEAHNLLKAIGYWPSVRAAIGDKLTAQLDALLAKLEAGDTQP
jgi:hypothetical protein